MKIPRHHRPSIVSAHDSLVAIGFTSKDACAVIGDRYGATPYTVYRCVNNQRKLEQPSPYSDMGETK